MPPPELSLARRFRKTAASLAPDSILVRRVPVRTRMISLTFDDGPDAETLELLDLLDELDVLATFFVIGRQAVESPDLIEQMVSRGHDVASHGYCHRKVTRMLPSELAADLERTHAALPPMPARKLFRPPHGDISAASLGIIAALGYTTVLWSIDSLDSRPLSATRVAEEVRLSTPSPGDILLLHEGEATTREALPMIVSHLRAHGLRIVPITTMLEARSGH